jgi:glutamate-1-semialdehyde aminotransferase
VSDDFIKALRKATKKHGAALIVDETGTAGGASGNGFWQYTGEADFQVFGKRSQVAGFFSADATAHSVGANDVDLHALKTILDVFNKEHQIGNVQQMSHKI